ncbi:MAG TPA: hypothetical protein VMV01_05480 [Planctomycetota bacterium]|nr:hypothetical protein [Planctomycetota bacterium]
MKAYLLITGTIFVLVTLAHVWRLFEEPNMANEPWYLVLTAVTAALGLWAWMLWRRPARP